MTDPDNAIEVKHVYKRFSTHSRNKKLTEYLVYGMSKEKQKENNVLNDINFSVKKGETLGIIGRNGSGKSTMLKLLTRILRPNSGTIETDGRIACLIELGAGFHPDMTGRENIYINASIFGIDKKTVDKRINNIIDFSEIGDHVDERVRNYSSGMYLRLAFSVAINVDADIMLVDEILAVGDIQFQKKCFDKIEEIKKRGVSIVLVTHNVDQAMKMCDKVMWIHDGYVKEYGCPAEVCGHYKSYMLEGE